MRWTAGRAPFVKECEANDFEKLREHAAARLKVEWLEFWWCKHYGRPLKDPLLSSYTYEELLSEFLMYAIDENPVEALPRGDQNNVQFRTGDPVVDEWERRVAANLPVDLMEGFLPEDREKVARFLNRRKKSTAAPEGFRDQYKKE